MPGAIRNTLGPVAGTLAAAFALLCPLTCAAGHETRRHAAMAHECSSLAVEQDCCSSEAAGGGQFTPSTKVRLAAPAAFVVAGGIAPLFVAASAPASFPAPGGSFHPPGSTPTYLRSSTLLI